MGEPHAETPLWRKYVNQGLRELARAWYGIDPDAFDEVRFLELFNAAMFQFAVENGVDWEASKQRLFDALDMTKNAHAPVFSSVIDYAVWRVEKAFLGVVRDAFLNDRAVLEYVDMGLRYFDMLWAGKRPPFPRQVGIGTLDYYEALEVPFAGPKERP